MATGIDAVMAGAKLTAGAFYAHFRSKEDLLAHALDASFQESHGNWGAKLRNLRGRAWVQRFVELYLSREHRDARGNGCPMPALSPEIALAGRAPRAVFEQHLAGLVKKVQERAAVSAYEDRSRTIAAIAQCVGGLMLARAVGEGTFSDEILSACRRAVVRGAEET